MITLRGVLRCKTQAEVALVHRLLPDHIRATRAEAGCLSFQVTETDDPMVWTVEEAFLDRAAFEAHQACAKSSPWGESTAHIARDYTVTGL